jgi:hypothetical protein
MFFLRVPFRRWSFRHHLVVAGLVLAAVTVGAWQWAQNSQAWLQAQDAELQSLQTQVQGAQRAALQQTSGDFTQSLPAASRSDEVIQELSRQAQLLGVQIASISVVATDPSVSELRKIQFNVNANGDYRAIKTWLGEMLGRYPSLAAQTLSIRGLPNDSLRKEAQLTFLFFVKD